MLAAAILKMRLLSVRAKYFQTEENCCKRLSNEFSNAYFGPSFEVPARMVMTTFKSFNHRVTQPFI